MKLLTKSVSIFATLVGVAALTSAPVKAESTFSGSATFSTPTGYTQTLSGELTTSDGQIVGPDAAGGGGGFDSPSVTAAFQDAANATPGTTGTLTIDAQIDYTNTTSIERVIAGKLNDIDFATGGADDDGATAAELELFNSIVQSAGGADGLE